MRAATTKHLAGKLGRLDSKGPSLQLAGEYPSPPDRPRKRGRLRGLAAITVENHTLNLRAFGCAFAAWAGDVQQPVDILTRKEQLPHFGLGLAVFSIGALLFIQGCGVFHPQGSDGRYLLAFSIA